MRIVAVDWSGAKANLSNKLWHAEASAGRIEKVRPWRSREELVSYLIDLASIERELVIGLDFAFSTPAWFLEASGLRSAFELWEVATRKAESWLANCETPFWGRIPGKRPILPNYFRSTDLINPIRGISPKSVFQIGGPGQVGTGSVRGWPHLYRLKGAGFSIWPFDPAAMPVVVEIYPRLLTGPVNKSSPEKRREYLDKNYPGLDRNFAFIAASSEDAFDATVSALVMAKNEPSFNALPKINDRGQQLEGIIWSPT